MMVGRYFLHPCQASTTHHNARTDLSRLGGRVDVDFFVNFFRFTVAVGNASFCEDLSREL